MYLIIRVVEFSARFYIRSFDFEFDFFGVERGFEFIFVKQWGLCRGGLCPPAGTSASSVLQCVQGQDSP